MAVEPTQGAAGARIGLLRPTAIFVTSVVALPVFVVSAYLLAWFAPEITAPGCGTASDWLDDYDATFLWLWGAAAGGAASASLVIALVRIRSQRWWAWALATLVATAFMLLATSRLAAAAWCPPPG